MRIGDKVTLKPDLGYSKKQCELIRNIRMYIMGYIYSHSYIQTFILYT
jgi:hypothetical protein